MTPGPKWFNEDGTRMTCTVENCTDPILSQSYCRKHLKRFLAHGNPNTILVAEKGKGCVMQQGYRMFKIKGRAILEHRLVMEKILGRKLKSHEIVHHIDENRLNNSPENLEIMTRATHIKHHKITTFRDETHKQCTYCKVIKPRWEFDSETKKKLKEQKLLDPHLPRCKRCRYLLDKRHLNRHRTPKYR